MAALAEPAPHADAGPARHDHPCILLRVYLACGLALLIALVLPACADAPYDQAEAASDAASAYAWGPSRHPDGIGKFYLGREIARLTGSDRDTAWMRRPGRETSELPGRVVQALELKPADVVADVGAGTGYFTFRLSKAVPQGKVLAVDVQPEMIEVIRRRVAEEGVHNVEPVLGTEQDPRLPAGSVDVALIVDAYHEFAYPREMAQRLTEALRPGGRLVLVAYRGEDPTLSAGPLRKLTQAQARKEMEAVGLRWRETRPILPQQHFMVFEKPAG